MIIKDLLQAIRRLSVETGSLACLGCGHEHNCSTHGCAILREAAERLAASPWISVKDRMPERERSYIVCTDKKAVCTAHWWGDHFQPHGGHITHWMPLPDAPVERV